jgi:hypothetical protein
MPDPTLDRAAAILRPGGPIAMTAADLARALDRPTDPAAVAALERHLAEDPRFLVLDRGAQLPGLDAWDARDRLAYATALRTVDLPRPPLVLLRPHLDPAPDSLSARAPGTAPDLAPDPAPDLALATSVTGLLRHTILELAHTPAAPRLAMAAEATRSALLRVSPPPVGSAPSTTPPPGPPPPG